MAKHFEFHFSESQPEEDCLFSDVEYPHSKTTSHTVSFSTDTAWDNILLEFAHFLDGVGYIGVRDRVQSYVDSYWEPVRNKIAEMEAEDENTSNPGLSD